MQHPSNVPLWKLADRGAVVRHAMSCTKTWPVPVQQDEQLRSVVDAEDRDTLSDNDRDV